MSDELKAKINWSCKFNKKSYQIIEGYLRIVEHTNLAYVEPHKVIIGDKLYLFFNEQKHFYIGNLKKKIFGKDTIEQKLKISKMKYLLK